MPFIHDEELQELRDLVKKQQEMLVVKDEQIEKLAAMLRDSHKMIRDLLEPKARVKGHEEDY